MSRDERRGGRLSRLGRALRRGAGKVRGRMGPRPAEGPVAVRFEGHGSVEVPAGTTLLVAARTAGVDVPHYCGGTCSCGTCRIEIVSGADNLSPAEGREQMVLGSERTRDGDRLACQARARGPVGVRVPDWF